MRFVQDGDGKGQSLAKAHRQGVGQRIEMRDEPKSLDELFDPGLRLLLRQMVEPCVQDQVLADRELAVERERLGHVAEVFRTSMLPASTELPKILRRPFGGRQGARSASSSSSTCRSRWIQGSRRFSPRSIESVTWSTAVKVPKRQVRPSASMAISVLPAGRGGMVSSVCPLRFSSGRRAMNVRSRIGRPGSLHQLGRRPLGQDPSSRPWR